MALTPTVTVGLPDANTPQNAPDKVCLGKPPDNPLLLGDRIMHGMEKSAGF
jgi:hypothetical protein